MKNVVLNLTAIILFVSAGAVVFREFTRPESVVPWWYHGNQGSWDMKHKVTPVGHDEVSAYFIRIYNIRHVQWRPNELWSHGGTGEMRSQVIDGKHLIRTVDGDIGFFQGCGQAHLPLTSDPWSSGKLLVECLDPKDDGRLLSENPQEGPSLTDILRSNGVKVIEPD